MNKAQLYIDTVRQLKNGQNDALIESIIDGFKVIQIEATGKCPCGDPNCDGSCGKKDEPKSAGKPKSSFATMESYRNGTDIAEFAKSAAKMIAESAYSAEEKEQMADGLEKYIADVMAK